MFSLKPIGATVRVHVSALVPVALFSLCVGALAARVGHDPPVAPAPEPVTYDWSALDTIRVGYTSEGAEPKTPIEPGVYKVVVFESGGRVANRSYTPGPKAITIQNGPRSGLHLVRTD